MFDAEEAFPYALFLFLWCARTHVEMYKDFRAEDVQLAGVYLHIMER